MPDTDTQATSEANSEETSAREERTLAVNTRHAIFGGLLAVLVIVAGAISVGQLSGAEARHLLEGALPSVRFFCSSVIAASATILALMLTLLSLSYSAAGNGTKLRPVHYKRLRQIALIDAIVLIGGVVLLILISIPISESDEISTRWFVSIYYSVIGLSSVLGGVTVSVVLMLYSAVVEIIKVISPGHSTELVVDE